MAPVRVVPGSSLGKACQAYLGVRLANPAVHEFALQRRKKLSAVAL